MSDSIELAIDSVTEASLFLWAVGEKYDRPDLLIVSVCIAQLAVALREERIDRGAVQGFTRHVEKWAR